MVEEGVVAVVLLDLAVAGVDLADEVAGGDGLARLEDGGDDVTEGVVADGGGFVVTKGGGDLVWEVVGADGEAELGVVGVAAEVVAADVAHSGDLALGGEREDVVG